MDTGTRSLRKAFRKGSWSDWPLAIGFSLFSRLLIVRERVESASELPWGHPARHVPHWREGPNSVILTCAQNQSPSSLNSRRTSRFHDSSSLSGSSQRGAVSDARI